MTPEDEDEIEASRAPLIEHLIELRARLIRALIAFVAMFFGCFAGAAYIYNILVWPYVNAVGSPEKAQLVYTHGLEYLFTQIQVAVFGAAFLAFPVIANEIYKFVAPGLYKHERRYAIPFVLVSTALFAAGVAVAFAMLPAALRVLTAFGGQELVIVPRASENPSVAPLGACR